MPEIYGQVNDISQIWNMNESQVRLVPLLRKAPKGQVRRAEPHENGFIAAVGGSRRHGRDST